MRKFSLFLLLCGLVLCLAACGPKETTPDDDDIAGADEALVDGLEGFFFTVEYPGSSRVFHHFRGDGRTLDHTAVRGQIAF